MASQKEVGGVVLAFAGFGALILAVKGTWSTVWHDLFHGSSTGTSGSSVFGGTSPLTPAQKATAATNANPNGPTMVPDPLNPSGPPVPVDPITGKPPIGVSLNPPNTPGGVPVTI